METCCFSPRQMPIEIIFGVQQTWRSYTYTPNLDEALTNSIRQVLQVPAMVHPLCCGKNTACILVRWVFVIAVLVSMQISEMTSHSNQNCFRSTRVPSLAASTSKYISMCLSLHEQQHLHTQTKGKSLNLLCPKTHNTMCVHIYSVWNYMKVNVFHGKILL